MSLYVVFTVFTSLMSLFLVISFQTPLKNLSRRNFGTKASGFVPPSLRDGFLRGVIITGAIVKLHCKHQTKTQIGFRWLQFSYAPTLPAALQFLFPSKPLMHSSWPSNIIQKKMICTLHSLHFFCQFQLKCQLFAKNVTGYSCCVIQAPNRDVSACTVLFHF